MYYFHNAGEPEIYVGSADMMERNLDRRVEALCPVRDEELRGHLRTVVLQSLLDDTHRASILQTDGRYMPATPRPDAAPLSSQQFLLDFYTKQPDQFSAE
jgi:polyphosphate kinase